jgi:hypothetical protein
MRGWRKLALFLKPPYHGYDQRGHLFAAIALFQAFRACKRVPFAIPCFLYFSKRPAA